MYIFNAFQNDGTEISTAEICGVGGEEVIEPEILFSCAFIWLAGWLHDE